MTLRQERNMMSSFPDKFLFYGCGNMGGAMLAGWIAAGVAAEHFVVVDPFAANLPEGVTHFRSASEAGGGYSHVLLGIKPQMLSELAGDVTPLLAPGGTLLSILAGTPVAKLQRLFPNMRCIRLMPNLAVRVGKSPLGFWGEGILQADRDQLDAQFAPLGLPVWLDGEEQMDAFMALAGSGPGFVYRFIDALAAGGAALGLDPTLSAKLAKIMVEGSATLAAQSDDDPATLAAKVASPGGTTAVGLSVLDRDSALAKLLAETLAATAARGAEMARELP